MTIRSLRTLALLATTFLLGGLIAEPAVDARRWRRSRKKARKKKVQKKKVQKKKVRPRAAQKRPPGYEKAKQIFIEGVKLFDAGDYPKAITRFRASLKHYANPKAHARIALCWKWIGNNLKALVSYEKFLKGFPAKPTRPKDIKVRREVELEVRNLLLTIARLKLSVSGPAGAEIRLNGKLLGRAPLTREIRLSPGALNVTVIAKGYYTFRKDLTLAANHSASIAATLIKIKPKVIRKVVHVRAAPIYKRWWFWTALGALLAGGATGLAVGLTSKQNTRDLSGFPLNINTLTRW